MDVPNADGAQPRSAEDEELASWILENVGGSIEHFERQSRWRGGWWIDVRRNGELLKLYVREERKEEFPPWPLEHEAGLLQLLQRHGIPVPHVYGVCRHPHAIVMEKVAGETNFALMKDEAERLSVLNHFAEVMAKMHAIDPRELAAIGVEMPVGDAQISLPCFDASEAMFERGKRRPEPRLEFLRRWIRRNIPKNREKVSVIAVDSGQFLYREGKVTALFDLEYGCLGDPMIDIAFVPRRGRLENMGDLRPFLKRYAELTGARYDKDLFAFHSIWWSTVTPLNLTPALHAPPADSNFYDYVGWYVVSVYSALETLAEMKGIELDRACEKAAEPARWTELFDVMAGRLPPNEANEGYGLQEQRKFIEFARRISSSPALEDEYLRAVERLVGRPVKTWLDADQKLEDFIIDAGPEHDETLIRLLHRWCLGQLTTFLHDFVYSPLGRPRGPSYAELLA